MSLRLHRVVRCRRETRMSDPKCPGQDKRYWKPRDIGDVTCPECGAEVELWKDEGSRKCPQCEAIVSRNANRCEWCGASLR